MAGNGSKKSKKKKRRKSIGFISDSSRSGKRKQREYLSELVDSGDVEELSDLIDAENGLRQDVEQMAELLQRACERGLLDVAALLLRHQVSPDVLGAKEHSPMHIAVKRGHLPVMALLLSHGASVNVKTKSEKRTPLHGAAIMGHETVAALLLENRADVDHADIYGSCPLHLACQLGRGSMTSLLLKAGANVDVYDNEGWTALHLASEAGHLEIVQLLLRHNANVNQQTRYGRTALHWAVLRERLKTVRHLLEADINVRIRDAHDKMAVEYASHPSVVKLIEWYSEKSDTGGIPSTLPAGAIKKKQGSVVGKMMKLRRPESHLSKSSLSTLWSDEELCLSRSATVSSFGTHAGELARTKKLEPTPQQEVRDATDDLQASDSAESIYDPQPESDRDNTAIKSGTDTSNVTLHETSPPQSSGRSTKQEETQKTTEKCPPTLRLSVESLGLFKEPTLKLPALNSSSGDQETNDRPELTEPVEPRETSPIPGVFECGSSGSSGSSSHSSSSNHGNDIENDEGDTEPTRMAGSAREQLKALESSLEDLMASTSKAMSKGREVTAAFLDNLFQWGRDTQHMLKALEAEMDLEQMATVTMTEQDMTSHYSDRTLPYVLHCHFLSAASRHIDTHGAGWSAFVEKLSVELDKLEGGSGISVPYVNITDTTPDCKSHEALFKLFRMAYCLGEPPMKYTLERCSMAGVDCCALLTDFVTTSRKHAEDDMLSASTVDLLAKKMGSDGQEVAAVLDVSVSDFASFPEDQDSLANHYYVYNNALLSQWQATFTGDAENMVLCLVDALISAGREDLLPILFH